MTGVQTCALRSRGGVKCLLNIRLAIPSASFRTPHVFSENGASPKGVNRNAVVFHLGARVLLLLLRKQPSHNLLLNLGFIYLFVSEFLGDDIPYPRFWVFSMKHSWLKFGWISWYEPCFVIKTCFLCLIVFNFTLHVVCFINHWLWGYIYSALMPVLLLKICDWKSCLISLSLSMMLYLTFLFFLMNFYWNRVLFLILDIYYYVIWYLVYMRLLMMI